MSENKTSSFLEKFGGLPQSEDNLETLDEQLEQQEETAEEVIETTPENVETTEEDNSFSFSFEQEEEAVEQPPLEAKVQDKVKYDLKSYVDSNYETIANYIKYRDLDVESMSNEELIRQKLKLENPSWNSVHIEQELQDTYGIGLKKKELPEDEFSDEYRKAVAHNERVDEITRRGERLLISDVSKAKQTLLSERERVLSLPEVELDVELTADPTKIVEQHFAKVQEEQTKYLEEVWKPSIQKSVESIGTFKQQIDLGLENGDKVVSELKYSFTKENKEKLKNYLENYVAHPSDEKYFKEDGEVDYQRFVNDKALQLFAPEIIKSSVKDLTAEFKRRFIKEEIVNYSDEPRTRKKENTPSKDPRVDFFRKSASQIFKR